MATSKRQWLFPVGLLFLCATLLASLVTLPEIVARLAYAAETGQSQAAKEHLARAADVSQAFQHVAKVMRPPWSASARCGGSIRAAVGRAAAAPGHPCRTNSRGSSATICSNGSSSSRCPSRGLEQRGLGTG